MMGTQSRMRTKLMTPETLAETAGFALTGNRHVRRAAMVKIKRNDAVKRRVKRIRKYQIGVAYKKLTRQQDKERASGTRTQSGIIEVASTIPPILGPSGS